MLKYFGHLCEVYALNTYFVTPIYIFRSVSNFNDIITVVVSRYSTNEILKCFV